MNTPDPKQKALELVEKFYDLQSILSSPATSKQRAKQCAIIAVRREIETLERLRCQLMSKNNGESAAYVDIELEESQSVLMEIEKL